MTRRIALTITALIGVLLLTTAIPLGIITTRHERDGLHYDTVTMANTLANLAEEYLVDHRDADVLTATVLRAARDGRQVAVYDAAGGRIAGTPGAAPAVAAAALADVLHTSGTVYSTAHARATAVVPVRDDTGDGVVGAVAFSQSSSPVDSRIGVLWTWLAVVTVAGLAAASLVATALARWVSRPLSDLDAAAARLGAGALDSRSATGRGPREVRRLAANFNTMAGRLEALVHDHRAVMADVSHQLRTPLAALRLRLDVLAQDAGEETEREIADAQSEIARLSRLVDGLLAVARAENTVVEPVPVPVDEVVRDRIAAWLPVARERGVALGADCRAGARAALGEGNLEQVLDNLLANALDAADAGGRIRVETAAAGESVRIAVVDDGPGMSDERRRAAFRRFASTTPGGTGLGLAIVHRVVTANGGTVALSETDGGGLTVTLEFPDTP